MIRQSVETAVREGIPFVINMADGRQYEVREQFQIALGATNVVFVDETDGAHVLPLLTMTGLSYLPKQSAAGQP